MFELTISRQQLLTPLLTVAGAVDKKQSLAILSNILLKLKDQQLLLTATDLEVAISARIPCVAEQKQGAITVPTKKMIDIIRSLDDDANPTILFKEKIVTIHQGRSQFKLATLPADDYPKNEDEKSDMEFKVNRLAFMHLLQATSFAMSQQDVRIFLNGLLLEIDNQQITAVATDGHRMAICSLSHPLMGEPQRLLIPRKGVQEALRLLNTVSDEMILLMTGKNHIKLETEQYTFSSKLIEARFPPYLKVIPKQQDKQVIIDSDLLKRALSRISILAHEKSRAVLLHIHANELTLIANNQEQEEAIESLVAQIQGDELKIGINAGYLLDVLSHLETGPIKLSFSTPDGSILVEPMQDERYQYIIMPMKI